MPFVTKYEVNEVSLTINSNPLGPPPLLRVGGHLASVNTGHVCGNIHHHEHTAHHPLTEDNLLPEPEVHHLGLCLQVGEEHQEGGGGAAKVPLYVQLCQLRTVHAVVTVECQVLAFFGVRGEGQGTDF